MERARKQRLVYGLWGLIGGVFLLVGLPTFWSGRWPPPLAPDQIFVVARTGPQSELLQFDPHQAGVVSRRPWPGLVIAEPSQDRLFHSSAAALWQLTASNGPRPAALVQYRLPDWTVQRTIPVDPSSSKPTFTPDGRQIVLAPNTWPAQVLWLDPAAGPPQWRDTRCESSPQILPPLQQNEAFLLCLWELWAIRPDGEQPLLTLGMGGAPTGCERYAGRPFAVAADQKRQRLWLTGEGGLLCQIDPQTGALRLVASLPIKESERVELTGLQLAPATDLLYVAVHPWDSEQIRRILVWDLQQNRLRTELTLVDPLLTFLPSGDGAHLYGLTASWPGGEAASRLVVIDVASGKVIRELGEIKGLILDRVVLHE